MSGETEKDVSGWTTDTLHMLVINLIDEIGKRMAADQIVVDRRFQGMSDYVSQRAGENRQRIDDLNLDMTRRFEELSQRIFDRMSESDRRYEQRFDAQEKAVVAALEAQQEETRKAETAAEKRFDSVNEFRGQLADQATTFAVGTEVNLRFKAVEERVNEMLVNQMPRKEIENRIDTDRSSASVEVKSLEATVVRAFANYETRFGALTVANAERTGSSNTIKNGYAYLFAGGGLIISIIGLILVLAKVH